MKKSSFYLSALALLMASCSSEEPFATPGTGDAEAASSFVTIRLKTTPTTNMSRAGENEVYENGTANENNVTRVRFYFFDAAGNPSGVHHNTASNTYYSYIDWYPTSTDVGATGTPGGNQSVVEGETVEKILTATLGLNLASEQPAQVLAVLNPNESVLNLANTTTGTVSGPSLSALQGVVSDYLTILNKDKDNFVMSNSVYVDKDNEIVYTTALDEENFAQSPEAAAANPVIIYVERVLARLDLGLHSDFLEGAVEVGDRLLFKAGKIEINDSISKDGTPVTDAEIYVELLGWNVTQTTSQSRLIKSINKDWTDTEIFGEGILWNTDNYHRSFWGINPDPETNLGFTYLYGNFNEKVGNVDGNLNPAQANKFPTKAGEYAITYLQENAAPFATNTTAPEYPSQVIVAAKLVDNEGNPLTIAEWGYKKYTLNGLKNQLAKVLNNLYSVETKDGATVYTRIVPDQLTFQYTDPMGEESEDKNYWVYAVLTDDAEDLTWQIGAGENGTSLADADAVNQYIRDMVNHVMIWNGGATYYYFNIRHLGLNDMVSGYNGVVRNHIYRSTIKSVAGLGVPVYDPNEIIVPEESENDDFILSVDLRILQWRVVNQEYELKWE